MHEKGKYASRGKWAAEADDDQFAYRDDLDSGGDGDEPVFYRASVLRARASQAGKQKATSAPSAPRTSRPYDLAVVFICWAG
jgi:hypothetical protein